MTGPSRCYRDWLNSRRRVNSSVRPYTRWDSEKRTSFCRLSWWCCFCACWLAVFNWVTIERMVILFPMGFMSIRWTRMLTLAFRAKRKCTRPSFPIILLDPSRCRRATMWLTPLAGDPDIHMPSNDSTRRQIPGTQLPMRAANGSAVPTLSAGLKRISFTRHSHRERRSR